MYLAVLVICCLMELQSRAETPCYSCGKTFENRIVGGEDAKMNEFPWQLSIALQFNERIIHFCGAAVISASWVLTASHCFDEVPPNLGTDSLMVLSGLHTTKTYDKNNLYRVLKLVKHPQYNVTKYMDNDIALINVDKPFVFTKSVQPICLPFDVKENLTGKDVTTSGWGRMQEMGLPSVTLQKVTLKVLDKKDCGFTPVGEYLTDNMFCTFAWGKDSCEGDSGGPLTYTPDGSANKYLVGVVSWGMGCARVEYPGVFTKVKNYLDWIKIVTGEDFCYS